MNSAWLCYNATRAGLTRWEAMHLPMGQVNDQIACYLISTGRAKEEKRSMKKTVHETFWNS